MLTMNTIRSEIYRLYRTSPKVHVNISIAHPRISLENDPVIIRGVYPNVFRIEENSTGVPKYHTLQYSDVLTGNIEIVELGK